MEKNLQFHPKFILLRCSTYIITDASGACMEMQAFFMLVFMILGILYPRGKL